MSRSRWLVLALLILAVPLALAACGGDDDDGGAGGEDEEITAAIEMAATGTDPNEKCTVVVTQSFVEQTQFSTGEEAVSDCKEEASDAVADSVEVSAIEVDDDTATAEAAFTGGGLDGQTLAISLVNEDEQWKLDRLERFVDFDAGAFAQGLAEDAAAEGGTPKQVIDCVVRQVDSADPEQIQTAYLSGDPTALLGLFARCFRQS